MSNSNSALDPKVVEDVDDVTAKAPDIGRLTDVERMATMAARIRAQHLKLL